MARTRVRDWILGLLFGAYILYLLIFELVERTVGYVKAAPPPHWGDAFSSDRIWMVLHMVAGVLVLLIGPLQFLPAVRDRFPKLHRAMGRTYILASLASIAALIVKVVPIGYCEECRVSNFTVTILWLLSVVAAYLSIRIGDVATHMAFMMRSYVFASYFMLARYFIPLFEPLLPKMSKDVGYVVTDFLCWLIPLVALEAGLFAWRYLRLRSESRQVESK